MFLNYMIDNVNTQSANPGFKGRDLAMASKVDAADSISHYIKFDSTPYETMINEEL